MINLKYIPEEVVEALHAIFADDFGTLIPKGSCRAAIAAVLTAWPGAEQTDLCGGRSGPALILPLQETPNAK